jgi:hypothetical protein
MVSQLSNGADSMLTVEENDLVCQRPGLRVLEGVIPRTTDSKELGVEENGPAPQSIAAG